MTFKNLLSIFLIVLSAKVFSQTPNTAKQKLFFEKVYLHLDREYFYAGEDIWFKAYLLNAQGQQLMATSNNLYVELIAPNATIESRKVIRLNDGTGRGDFKLGDTIVAGKYKLRAYTNWMLNFGDNFIFEKEINVSVDETLQPKTTSPKTIAGSNKSSSSKTKESIQFFPEGGSMIEGVTGVVAFKAVDGSGKEIKANGSIISSRGDTISTFQSNALGLGSFMLKPEQGTTYSVKGLFANKQAFNEKLPAFLPQGFSMHLIPDSSKVTIIISTNEATLNAYKGKQLEIKARHAGLTYLTQPVTLSSVITKLVMPNDILPEGIASVTLTDDQLRPHCERLVYIDRGGSEEKISISTDKPVYRSRERVSLKIKTSGSNNQGVKTNLSVAVVDAGIVAENTGNIVSYLNLESELRGKIAKPENYFNPENPARFKQLDLLLMTQGWRDFVWKRIKDTTITIRHINETGFTVSGQVKDKKSKEQPLAGANVTLFATGAKGQKLLGTTTNQEGKYYFDNMNLEGNQSIKLVSSDLKGKKTGVLSLDSLYNKPLPVQPFNALEAKSPLLALFKAEAAFRSRQAKKFDMSDSVLLNEVKIKGSNTVDLFEQKVISFGYPDQNFTMTDQDEKDYQSLRHYLLTNVNGATPDTNMDRNGVFFRASGENVYPRFMVDKREDTFDRLDYYDLRMKDIQKIVVRHMMGTPSVEKDTIVSSIQDVFLIYLTLKPSAFARAEPSLINTIVNGYYQERVFYSPKFPEMKTSKKQDLRTTIYWHPDVVTDDNGEATITYLNADPKTKVRIVAEGINAKGVPVAGTIVYEVK